MSKPVGLRRNPRSSVSTSSSAGAPLTSGSCSRPLIQHASSSDPATVPDTTKPPEIRGFHSVGTVRSHSIKSTLLPPSLSELQKIAAQQGKVPPLAPEADSIPRRLERRLKPALTAEIAAKYLAGATTPALCTEYGLSKGGVLKLLREQGVQLRCQPLSADQVEHASSMYTEGLSIAKIADHFGVSYNGVRQAFIRAGIERRPRGGSYR